MNFASPCDVLQFVRASSPNSPAFPVPGRGRGFEGASRLCIVRRLRPHTVMNPSSYASTAPPLLSLLACAPPEQVVLCHRRLRASPASILRRRLSPHVFLAAGDGLEHTICLLKPLSSVRHRDRDAIVQPVFAREFNLLQPCFFTLLVQAQDAVRSCQRLFAFLLTKLTGRTSVTICLE